MKEIVICPQCGGAGTLSETLDSPTRESSNRHPTVRVCPTCMGRGKVYVESATGTVTKILNG